MQSGRDAKRKKTRRSQAVNPGLQKQYNSKLKQEYMDFDYVAKLSPELKEYYNDFIEEYYGAQLDYENLENNRFHKTQEEKKACTDRVNARNRCQYGMAKATKTLHDVDSKLPVVESENQNVRLKNYVANDTAGRNIEDDLIEYLDTKNSTDQDPEEA